MTRAFHPSFLPSARSWAPFLPSSIVFDLFRSKGNERFDAAHIEWLTSYGGVEKCSLALSMAISRDIPTFYLSPSPFLPSFSILNTFADRFFLRPGSVARPLSGPLQI